MNDTAPLLVNIYQTIYSFGEYVPKTYYVSLGGSMKIAFVFWIWALSVLSIGANIPHTVVPNGWGVNIHFTGAPKQELDQINQAGWRMIRMDFAWEGIEKQKGVYQFEPYDQLLAGLLSRGMRPIFILDYSNRLYETDSSVRTETGRKAFAAFARAAALRYKGKPILWELWNEPNIGFWKPTPNVDDYMALAMAVIPVIHEADPNATCIAPATASIDLGFLEGCFRRGLLKLVDAISVHPYRSDIPETAIQEYQNLRLLIARIDPTKQNIPILSGEWGYSTATSNFTEIQQRDYIVRQYLTNLSQNIPVSIWYDWIDDGPDPNYNEHRFGTVQQDHQPKPSYLAAKELVHELNGMSYIKRMNSLPDDYLLMFRLGNKLTLAAWTTAKPHSIKLDGLAILNLNSSPIYVDVPANAQRLRTDAAWQIENHRRYVKCGVPDTTMLPAFSMTVSNPLSIEQKVAVGVSDLQNLNGSWLGATQRLLKPGQTTSFTWRGRSPLRRDGVEKSLNASISIGPMKFIDHLDFVAINELSLGVSKVGPKKTVVTVKQLQNTIKNGRMIIYAGSRKIILDIDFKPGIDTSATMKSPVVDRIVKSANAMYVSLNLAVPTSTPIRAVIVQDGRMVSDSGKMRIRDIFYDASKLSCGADGNPTVSSTYKLENKQVNAPFSQDIPALKFGYNYADGWKFVRISTVAPMILSEAPSAISVWVCGDGSKCNLAMRFVDKSGRTFQTSFGRMDFRGWRLMSCDMKDVSRMGQWGGPEKHADRMILPLKVDTLMIVDSPGYAVKGEVLLAGMNAVYLD